MIIKYSDEYGLLMIEIDGKEMYTIEEFAEKFNYNELVRNEIVTIQFGDFKDHIEQVIDEYLFMKYNNEEFETLNNIFINHYRSPKDDIWETITEEVYENRLSFEIVEQYIKMFPDKKEYLYSVMKPLHYGRGV